MGLLCLVSEIWGDGRIPLLKAKKIVEAYIHIYSPTGLKKYEITHGEMRHFLRFSLGLWEMIRID
jgi:hypothetical protein